MGSGRRVKGTTFPHGSVTILVVVDVVGAVDTAADAVGVRPRCSIRGFLFLSVVGGLIGDAPENVFGARVGDEDVDAAVGGVEVAVVVAATGAAEAVLFGCFLQEG